MAKQKTKKIGGESPTNGADSIIATSSPYEVEIEIEGTCPLLFHRWNCEEVEAKAASKKGSAARKTDNLDTMIFRNDKNEICLPGEYFRQAIIHAAKYHQDPRSPRKSAMDLAKALIVCLTDMASLGVKKWDFEDKRRVTIQRASVTRTRPAFNTGWKATFIIQVLESGYIDHMFLNSLVSTAGRLIGVGNFRPTFGRFQINRFKVL